MELSDLIDSLEEALNAGRHVPATKRVLVEGEKIAELLDQIRAAIPADIHEAQELLHMRENVINQSLMEARRIKSTAEEEAKALVKESEILKEARRKGEELTGEAQRKAQRILDEADLAAQARRAGADRYAQDVLQKLEEELANLLNTVRRGLEVLDLGKQSPA